MFNIEKKTVTVIGAKRSGLALVKLILFLKGVPRLSDGSALDQETKIFLEQNRIVYEEDRQTESFVTDTDLLVISPGVRPDSGVIRWAKERNIPVLGEIEFAYQFCRGKVIGVTASNGKTTVVTLIHKILQAAGYQSCLCGNIGNPFSLHAADFSYEYFVLELSSFQLESMLGREDSFRAALRLKGFHPSIAVLLNFSQNHLDRHKDMEEYFLAKTKMFLNQESSDYAVLNARDERLQTLAPGLSSKVNWFNTAEQKSRYDFDNPNYFAALSVAEILGIPEKTVLDVFENFSGVEHRLERVAVINGAEFVNDSKATTVESGRWALEHTDKPVIMIAGGRDKNLDFVSLKELVQKKVKHLLVIGEAGRKLRDVFSGVADVRLCETLKEAVFLAGDLSAPGDCVLLSPMCASFDMFKNYEERGAVFKNIVYQLKEKEDVNK